MDKPRLIAKEFLDFPNILNIELGAGCGNFGHLYHKECFLTDEKSIFQLRSECPVCHVTISCDAHKVPCPDNRFEKIIICNPYGYGFRDEEHGLPFLSELYRILQPDGESIILTTYKNSYSTPSRVKKNVNNFNADFEKFTYEATQIVAGNLYPGFKFFTSDNVRETYPNWQILLRCKK